MRSNQFDHLIPEVSQQLLRNFIDIITHIPEFREDVNTSAVLNLSVSVFVTLMMNMLDFLQSVSVADDELFKNMELTKNAILKAIEDLPFVSSVKIGN